MKRKLTVTDVNIRLRRAIDQYGSAKEFAAAHDMSQAYVSDVRQGRKDPSQKILNALGLKRVILYEQKEKTDG